VAASIGEKAGAPRGTTVLTESTVADNGNGFKESAEPRTSNPSPELDAPSRANGATPPRENGLMTPNEISAPEKSAKPEKKKPRHVGRWIVRTFWLTLAATAVAALFYLQPELQVGGPLNILPVRNADIRTEIDGLVEKIFVTEGASVRKGELVGRLSIRENRSELEKTHGQIQQSSAKLRLQVAGPTPDEIELARTAVVKAKDNLNFARVKLEAMKELFANHLAARLELDTAQQQYATAKDDLDDAEGKLKVLQNGTRSEEIDATKAEISGFQAQQHFLEGQIQRADIRSPVDGIVATPELQLKEMAGQVVQKGALIAKVFDLRKLRVEIAVPESEIADIKVGQSVILKVRAYPNQTFNGFVTSVATNALSETSAPEAAPVAHTSSAGPEAVKTILVTTEIDNSSLLLKPGMTGHAKILCGRRRLLDVVTRRLAHTVKVQFWSWF
jgi:multidrug resistance efflux pump